MIKYQFDAKLGYVCRWALCIWIQYRLSENKVIVTHLLGVQGPRDDVVWRLSSAYQLLIFTNLLTYYSSIVMIYIWWRLARCFVKFLHWHKVERGINILWNYGNLYFACLLAHHVSKDLVNKNIKRCPPMFTNLGLCNAYIIITRSLLDQDLSSSK